MVNREKNLCAYNRFDTQDGHGGRAEEHRAEMAEIARQTVAEVAPSLIEEICNRKITEAVESFIGAIEWDIHEIVNVSFDDMGEVFKSEKFRKVISNRIMESIKNNLKNFKIK